MRRALPVLTVLSFALGLSALHSAEESMKYPETHKGDVADALHGTKVADPYRWLEQDVAHRRKSPTGSRTKTRSRSATSRRSRRESRSRNV